MVKSLKVLKVKDKSDSFTQPMATLMDIPFRGLLVARSGHGKSNLLTNIILNKKFGYDKFFEGDDIHIFAPDIMADDKLKVIVETKDIPDYNLHNDYSDELLLEVYEGMIEDYKESIAEGVQPDFKLIIIDDMGFSGKFSSQNKYNALNKVFCNSRKFLVSVLFLQQSYLQTTPSIRLNASIVFIFNSNLAQLEAVEKDHNYLRTKKDFLNIFRQNVKTKFDFLCINYSNDYKDLYLNSQFESILEKSNYINNEAIEDRESKGEK